MMSDWRANKNFSHLLLVHTKNEEHVFRPQQNKHSLEQVFACDVRFNVMCMMLDAERQKLDDDGKQVSCLIVICMQQV